MLRERLLLVVLRVNPRVAAVVLAGVLSLGALALPIQAQPAKAASAGSDSESASPESASPESRIVEALHAVLIANLRDGDEKGFEARLQRVAPVVARSFDFAAVARVALGRNIESLDAAAQVRFEELLEALSAATYAQQFSGDQAQAQFVFAARQPARGGRVLLRTRLQRPGKAPLSLDYVLHDSPQGPRIVNVLADGVSDLSLKRAQYAAVIRTEGIAALFERIEEQLAQIMLTGR